MLFRSTPFGVDTERFKPTAVNRESGKFIFCTVKTLAPKYGVVGLVGAFSLFMKKVAESGDKTCDIEYRIYGKGPQQSEIEDLIARLGLTDKVLLKGYIANASVPEVLNGCDVFLLKSELDSESFGVAAVEAMACAKPVIASDVSGFKEVIEDGVSGIIVERNDIEKFAEQMFRLYKDGKLRAEIGENARKRAKALYDWQDNVSTMLSVYERLR